MAWSSLREVARSVHEEASKLNGSNTLLDLAFDASQYYRRRRRTKVQSRDLLLFNARTESKVTTSIIDCHRTQQVLQIALEGSQCGIATGRQPAAPLKWDSDRENQSYFNKPS